MTRFSIPFLLLTLLAAPAHATDEIQPPSEVVVFGDSQAQGLAAGLQRALRHVHGWKVDNRTKPGTAITQDHTYDWQAVIAAYKPDEHVTTAVLMFGGNDRMPIHPASGGVMRFRTPAWQTEYRARVAAILHTLSADKLRIIWVSDPICRDDVYSADMDYLNGLYKDVVARTGATYFDIWTAVADPSGKFIAYGPALDGTTQRLRLDDGIHFTPTGYDILAAKVLQLMTAPAPKLEKSAKAEYAKGAVN
jgi:hypothetical protein